MCKNVKKLLVFFTLLLLFINCNNDSITENITQDESIIAFYPFNKNANDVSGNNNHGEVKEAILTSDRFGKADCAYLFDGINDYISIQNYQNFNNLDSFTITAWIYPMDFSHLGCIVSKVDPNRDFDLKLYYDRLSLEFYNNQTYYVCRMDNQLPINEWIFVAGTWNGSELKIYINGEHIKTSDFSGYSPAWTGTKLQIGKLSEIEAFAGKIDDLCIYNIELNEFEILKIYLN